MKLFTKTLLTAAVLAGATGAAQASIATGANAEAFMQVYDKTNTVTYDLDLGVTLAQLTANPVLSYDLSADANWQTFSANMDQANTKFGVVVGYSTKGAWTSMEQPTPPPGANFVGINTNIKNQSVTINNKAVANTALNVSKLVYDTDTKGTGQWATTGGSANLDNLFGSYTLGHAAVAFGTDAPFWFMSATGTAVTAIESTNVWSLSATALTFAPPPATVPLPAAVWMFGAGLLGMLRLNRRKV